MEKLAIREEFDFFDIVDDFSEEQDFIIDDALLEEIYGNEDTEESHNDLPDYLDDFVEFKDEKSEKLSFYQEYVGLLDCFTEHYDNVKLQYPGLYASVKDDNERSEKLMKVAIRDCPTELLGKMVVASIYDRHHFFCGLNDFFFSDPFEESSKKDVALTSKTYAIGSDFNKLLHYAEDTLVERQRMERKGLQHSIR